MDARMPGFLSLLLVACSPHADSGGGGGTCAGSHNGIWRGVTVNDTLTLDSSCLFGYARGSTCQSSGTYGAPLGLNGTVQVHITSSTGGLCLPAGTYSCTYTLEGNNLTFDCGSGALHYSR